jgi:hypothetical protein
MMLAFAIALIAAADTAPAAEPSSLAPAIAGAVRAEVTAAVRACRGDAASAEIVVCGPGPSRYRIDPDVLAASRVREAPPLRPELSADAAAPASAGCIGPMACQGDFVPLVGMALAAARAVALAANGDDWREALRTRPDEYRLYQERQDRRARERRVRLEVGLGK